MAKKAVLYLRSSKDRHDVSVESQHRELTEFAKHEGTVIVDEYIDKVESAKTDNRPGFQAMIAEAKSNECRFDTIYCYDTSRFARRQYHAQMYKHLLKKRGIQILYLKLPKTETILDPIIESLMEAFDEFHSQKSKIDGLRGMRENIEQGWRAGGRAILGYQLDKHIVGMRDGKPITKSKLVPDPKIFKQVQAYLKGRSKNESRKSLIKRLDLDITYNTLVYIEESALTYAGHTVWNRHNEYVEGSYVGGKKFKDRSEWVIKRDTHEALISDDEANAILNIREQHRRKGKRMRVNDYLLSCMFKCSCGANLDGDGGYYRCHDRCGTRSIKKETLEEAVINVLFEDFLSDQTMKDLRASIEKEIKEREEGSHYQLQALESELKTSESEISKLVEILPQVQHKRSLLERLDELELTRLNLELQIQEEKQVSPENLFDMSNEAIAKFLKRYKSDLKSGDMEIKKAVIRSLVESGEFDGNQLLLHPNVQQITGVKVASPRVAELITAKLMKTLSI